MNIIGIKGSATSSYTVTNDLQKTDSKINENSKTSKEQAVTQVLGTDTFVKSTENDVEDTTYKLVKKKLSTEEIKEIKVEQENVKIEFIKKFIADTINNQNKLLGKSTENGISEMPKETTDLLTKIFGSVENAYPQMATTSEGAKEAIEEGGAYSVTGVADRIMTMAMSIAGDDPAKIQQMRDAVEKGFSEAGLDFNKATNSDLPQICKDTCSEVMSRFDKLLNKTSTTN
ncbi:hypothetical protein [Clostridium lacusfryxellense]|uniref:hypothetical protein n=1 Tax=Clostridium lacusfryxellense TaxID=205328 RepID=UPI001C0C5239|nr:hypothetical protein [Clostridium lacusfryxellense]MBU3109943.1 hypothetical protein [Clostridium lacusfryxellense]